MLLVQMDIQKGNVGKSKTSLLSSDISTNTKGLFMAKTSYS